MIVIGFIAGVAITGLVWYVKDYCMDSLYCKGYARGYRKAVEEAGDGIHDGRGRSAFFNGRR